MMKVWIFSFLLLLSMASNVTGLQIDHSQIRVFPDGYRIAGVFQASYQTILNELKYAFNASDAREVCEFLGVSMASKAEVDEANRQGLETCRYGWVDEHFAVIPRVMANEFCGKNDTGVVMWRASVKKPFDVFCFNQSDMELQLEDTTTDTPLTMRVQQEQLPHLPLSEVTPSSSASHPTAITTHVVLTAHSPPRPTSLSLSSPLSPSVSPSTSLHLSPDSTEAAESDQPQPMNTAHSAIGVVTKVLLITSTFVFLLTAMAIFWYFKLNQSHFLRWNTEQDKENIETEEWTHNCMEKEDLREEPEEDCSRETADDVSVNMNTETKTDADTEP